jgi:hypothetical protein
MRSSALPYHIKRFHINEDIGQVILEEAAAGGSVSAYVQQSSSGRLS